MKNKYNIFIFILVLALAILACSKSSEPSSKKLNLYPTNTLAVSSTALVIEITSTPMPTYTPNATYTPNPTNTPIILTQTPLPIVRMCVIANESVYLRPSPNSQYYPINPLLYGDVVVLTGAKSDDWVFVEWKDDKGWINSKYLGSCE